MKFIVTKCRHKSKMTYDPLNISTTYKTNAFNFKFNHNSTSVDDSEQNSATTSDIQSK